jgi:hypothetical protein
MIARQRSRILVEVKNLNNWKRSAILLLGFLHAPTWFVSPSPLYCVIWYTEFIEVGVATAIPKRLSKEMQYA